MTSPADLPRSTPLILPSSNNPWLLSETHTNSSEEQKVQPDQDLNRMSEQTVPGSPASSGIASSWNDDDDDYQQEKHSTTRASDGYERDDPGWAEMATQSSYMEDKIELDTALDAAFSVPQEAVVPSLRVVSDPPVTKATATGDIITPPAGHVLLKTGVPTTVSFSSVQPDNPWTLETGSATSIAPSALRTPMPLSSSNPYTTVQAYQENATHTSNAIFDSPSSPDSAWAVSDQFSPKARSTSGMEVSKQRVETARTISQRQRKECYEIRNIRWIDCTSSSKPRESSILVQNANGPCPLLALVNTLVLTTPSIENTGLVETLRTREQVSLGLLLDAVFDELTSGRRGDVAQDLPDVGDLYSFLIALHTGMNVNPRFIPSDDATECGQVGSFLANLGTFEQTAEMKLYSTFSIPLIHGWIPQRQSPSFLIFARTAPTYEEAASVLSREDELELKMNVTGLSSTEELLREDIAVIKQFLDSWPTQLTAYGLEAIDRAIRPGQFTIFFRNDHFSTLYKEPKTGQLMTLVTDAGLSSHEEIVWESLVDINGAHNELFAGDFQSVSHNVDATISAAPIGTDSGWTTVPDRRGLRRNEARAEPAPALPARPAVKSAEHPSVTISSAAMAARATTEQEDHDLALALQLQGEEEERERDERTARDRENQLSQQYLSQESARTGPPMPPRPRPNGTQGRATGSESRATGSESRADEEAYQVAPPTYQQAAAAAAYRPVPGYSVGLAAPPRNGSLHTQQSLPANRGRGSGAGPGRGQSDGDTLRGRNAAGPSVGRRKASSRQSTGAGQTSILGGNSRPATSVTDEVPATTGEDNKEDEKCTIM